MFADTKKVNNRSFLFESKGETWKAWNNLRIQCVKSELIKDPVYLGITNTIGLGAIMKKNFEVLEREMDIYAFADTEIHQIISKGRPSSCQYIEIITMDFSVFTNSDIQGVNAELNSAIKSSKNFGISISGWQVDNLKTGVLADILNGSNEPKKISYRNNLLKEDRLILSRVVRVLGFSADIHLSSDVSTSLKVSLQDGVLSTIGNSDAALRFEYIDDKTIRVRSLGDFIVFGQFVKAREVEVTTEK